MPKQYKNITKMKKIILEFFIKLLGLPTCKKCGSTDVHKGHYTSGWNNLCQQASGDNGTLCCNCWHVEFEESFEVRKEKTPKWVTLHR
jgi:hypothetical protein